MITIVPYTAKYKDTFERLNKAWIKKHFVVEDLDRKALEHPKEYILDNGGHILIALDNEKPVGACALIKMDDEDYDYELAKMAVSQEHRGKGIGEKLCRAVIEKARSLGARAIFLESNQVLAPAIKLYEKVGFKKLETIDSLYSRCDIQMSLNLEE